MSDVAQHIDWDSASDGTILRDPAILAEFWDDVLQNPQNEGSNRDPFAGLAQALTAGLDCDYNSAANTTARHTADAIAFLLHSFNSSSHHPLPQTPSSLHTHLDSPQIPPQAPSPLHTHLLSLQPKHPQGDRLRYQKDIVWICTKRRLFHTRDGLFGLGPLVMQPGDVVAILHGGYTPFVLRPRGEWFLLVGECYVNDVMGGDALEMCECEEWRGRGGERVFRLR